MKIGLVVIATGAYYHTFIEPLLASVRKHFLVEDDVRVHLWTDSLESYEVAHQYTIAKLDWPFPTLYRYHNFLDQIEDLAQNDYIFYLDVDMLIVDSVGQEIFGDGITATIHPLYVTADAYKLPYEQNPASTAFVARQCYFAGGFQGGRTKAFLAMAASIKQAIDVDLSRDLIAIWHDESHLNKYLTIVPPATMLDPSYCFPEDGQIGKEGPMRTHLLTQVWRRDYHPRILALTKKTQER